MNPEETRRWRGMVLELVYTAFRDRQSAHSYLTLWSMMQKLGQSLGLNDVAFTCRWLRDSGYLTFNETRDRWTNEVKADALRITPKGCSVVEGTVEDANVLVLI